MQTTDAREAASSTVATPAPRLAGWMEHVARPDLGSSVTVTLHADTLPSDEGMGTLPLRADTPLDVRVEWGNGNLEWLDGLTPRQVGDLAAGLTEALALLRASGIIPVAAA